jgi:hypothetical protein
VAVKFKNNAYTTLSAGINGSVTTIPVVSTSLFPTLGGSDHMYVSIIGGAYVEIIKVTSFTSTAFTCVRNQEGTTGTAAVLGNRIELRVTTAMITDAIADSNVDVFKTIEISGQTDVVADSGSDTLTLVATGGTTLTTTADQITIDTPVAGASKGFATAMAIAL